MWHSSLGHTSHAAAWGHIKEVKPCHHHHLTSFPFILFCLSSWFRPEGFLAPRFCQLEETSKLTLLGKQLFSLCLSLSFMSILYLWRLLLEPIVPPSLKNCLDFQEETWNSYMDGHPKSTLLCHRDLGEGEKGLWAWLVCMGKVKGPLVFILLCVQSTFILS